MAVSRTPIRVTTFEGRHAKKATASTPTDAGPVAFALRAPSSRPRPALSRYPISREDFLELKARAHSMTEKRLPTRLAAKSADRAKPGAIAIMSALAPGALPPASAPTPAAVSGFAGIPASGWVPPDCTLAAGPEHVLVAVNSSVAIYPKAGGAAVVSLTLDDWYRPVVADAKIFDPKAAFDAGAMRWILVACAIGNQPTDRRSFLLLSVSQTADPRQGWFHYALDARKEGTTTTNNWADYPGLGVDPLAIYLTANMFGFDDFFQYAKIRIIDKAAAYAGASLTFTDLTRMKNEDGSLAFTIQPCLTHGAPGAESLVNSYYPTTNADTPRKLSLWTLTDPLGDPRLARATVTVDPFALPPDAKQKGGGPELDTGDVRILNAVFRQGSVWTALTTAKDWGDGAPMSSLHWFQINATDGTLVQQGVFGQKALSCSYPALYPTTVGAMAVVFCRVGTAELSALRYASRLASDAAGTLRASALLRAGVSTYAPGASGEQRWGDYAGASADVGSDDLWFYGQNADAGGEWGTWVARVRV